MNDLLIEIGCEELPPKTLLSISLAFAETMATLLEQAQISFATIYPYASPRRLALLIKETAGMQAEQHIERKGPPISMAYDDAGKPTQAALKFAESCATTFDNITTIRSDKGEWLYFQQHVRGQCLAEVLPHILMQAFKKLPLKKPMRWANHEFSFIRPVHWLLILHGNQVIPATLFGVNSSNITYGHRYHCPQAITLHHANDYLDALYQAKVVADFTTRQQLISQQIAKIAHRQQATAVIEPELLQEVTAMVEWPVALLGRFNPDFLQVPTEALVCAIREHQRCFHLLDDKGMLLASFITISNIESYDPNQVVAGNQRVMHARLADAQFFYQQDCKQPLSVWYERLADIVFQQKLGSVQAKTQRVSALATHLCQVLAVNEQAVTRAAQLAKVDLLSAMVGEFPELQGIMGYYYALAAGETTAVATAIREHYLPRFATDIIPQTQIGSIIAIADRLDSLLAIFSIGQKPTGDKDPFGLRRAAMGVVRIIVENQLSIDLLSTLTFAASLFACNEMPITEVHLFILDRLSYWYKQQGFKDDHIQAVLYCQNTNLADMDQRLRAVASFLATPEAVALAAANKRVRNLLNKTEADPMALVFDINRVKSDSEMQLATALQQQQTTIIPLLKNHQYSLLLQQLAQLQQPVDQFFATVMVMDDDLAQRQNRLALLEQLRKLFLHVADFSLLNS